MPTQIWKYSISAIMASCKDKSGQPRIRASGGRRGYGPDQYRGEGLGRGPVGGGRRVVPRTVGPRSVVPRNPTDPTNRTDEGVTEPVDPLDLLFPTKPEDEKVQPGDYKFEITWTIRLLRPEDTRGADDSSDAKQPGKQADASNQKKVRS